VKRLLWIGGGLLLLGLAAAGAFVAIRLHESRNIHGSSSVEFTTALEPTTVAAPPAGPHGPKVLWPEYGYGPERIRIGPGKLRPPFRRVWTFKGQSLLEFPPAIGYGRLYLATNAGVMVAVNAKTGKRAWKEESGRCVAASPALGNGVVYEAFLNRPPCNATGKHLDGVVIAYAVGFGHVLWRHRIGPSESSPLVANGRVYVGDWNGDVWALGAGDGHVVWRRHVGGKLKGGVALTGNRLYVGSYNGHLSCLDARTGKVIWRASAQQRLGGLGAFYATPAVAYGRVYVGSTDGKVYSFGATTGKLRWSHSTSGYVYSSAAITDERVLVGSYGGDFLALDAATGDLKWRFKANGPISGSPTVIGGVVYFATLKRRTYALDVASGRLRWSYPDGKYSPVVTDGKRLYLIGYTHLYGMVPRR
jgi:outer membrane protein assembly factor BamB